MKKNEVSLRFLLYGDEQFGFPESLEIWDSKIGVTRFSQSRSLRGYRYVHP